METTIVKLSLLTMLEQNIDKLVDAVYSYLERVNFILPKFETKPNEQGQILSGNYIPMNSVVKLDEKYIDDLKQLEFNDFDKFGFYSFTINGNKKSYRCNLSINNKGKFGCSLIPIETSQLQLTSNDLTVNESEVITIG